MKTIYNHRGIRLEVSFDVNGYCRYHGYASGKQQPEIVTASLTDTLKWAESRTGYPFDIRQVVDLARSILQD